VKGKVQGKRECGKIEGKVGREGRKIVRRKLLVSLYHL
jgi:hypothetical protein